jgi:hypothetical protein
LTSAAGGYIADSTVKRPTFSRSCAVAAMVLTGILPAFGIEPPSSGKIDFTRDIRPLLSDNCFHCHGNDEHARKGKLRLDTKDGLFSKHEDVFPVVPGKLAESEAWLRVTSTDPDDVMPPPKEKKTLTPAQLDKLKRWIEQGAPYREHWAYQAPVRPELPAVQNAWWPRNPVDRFIAAQLEAHHLQPSPEAAKELLLRRVTFDLTGLPPTLAEIDAFLADTAPDAYEHVVDRLLASSRFGERMARPWLDAARYGDTHGLHLDNERSIWPYRDWVVRAFNENLPYDQFTIWQLAGDLLPNPTRDQLIATGFSRCNVTTSEGGAINEEFAHRYAVDRTETAVSIWMGLTAGCAVCHDHKFDPISQKEFYSLYSFFNSAADPAMDGNAIDTPPILRLTTPEQDKRLGEIEAKSKAVEASVTAELAKVEYTDPASEVPPPGPKKIETVWVDDEFPEGAHVGVAGHPLAWATAEEKAPVFSGKRALRRTAEGIAQDYFDGAPQPYFVPASGRIFAYVWLDPVNPPKAIMLQWHAEGEWKLRANWGDPAAITFGKAGTPEKLQIGPLPKTGEWVRLQVDVRALKLKPGTVFDGLAFTQYGGTAYWDRTGVAYEDNAAADPGRSQLAWEKESQGKLLKDPVPKEIKDIFRSVPPKERKPEHTAALRRYYFTEVCATTRPRFEAMMKERAALEEERKKEETGVVKTFIMHDVQPRRITHLMIRGQYDKPGEEVQPGVPAIFPPLPPTATPGALPSRLELAEWLVSPKHPLTARVAVNRFWQLFFGTGLVKTSNDFGAQGEPPSHPELLDWLAVDFREHGWDMKRLVRLLVTSATYRQDSRTTPQGLEADPENRLLAHGPRYRLDAEEVRDNSLFVSGLIDLTMGGKGVKPYQPERIWEPVGFVGSNTRDYHQDHGAALYRRSLYTFWKRTAPPPNMMVFDTPSREQYCTRRERSNTPLQALVMMNDVQQFEAARALGQRMMVEGGIAPADRIAYGFRLVTARRPLEPERETLRGLFERQLERYVADPASAGQAVSFGESKPNASLNPSELAAWTLVANVLLNLDETLNKN